LCVYVSVCPHSQLRNNNSTSSQTYVYIITLLHPVLARVFLLVGIVSVRNVLKSNKIVFTTVLFYKNCIIINDYCVLTDMCSFDCFYIRLKIVSTMSACLMSRTKFTSPVNIARFSMFVGRRKPFIPRFFTIILFSFIHLTWYTNSQYLCLIRNAQHFCQWTSISAVKPTNI
jgi:hypothetical protein